MINFIVKLIIRYLKGAWQSFKIGKLENEVNEAKKEAKREVKEANDNFNELMDLYDQYSSGESIQGDQGKPKEEGSSSKKTDEQGNGQES